MNLAMQECGDDKQEITRILDAILCQVMFGEHLDAVIERIRNQPSQLIQRRQPKKGEQLLQTAMGNCVDSVFKCLVLGALQNGPLAPYAGRLTVTPGGARGPDVYMAGAPMIALDVTTRGSASDHVERDNIRRGWDRYYLLIWDEPATGFRKYGRIQRLTRRV
ncbi:MAG: hypothetical protein ACK5AZ_20580 [Bryobacteraceae bacterium]